MNFTSVENPENDSQCLNVSCSFQVSSQIPYELQNGQALITFEKEEGMSNLKNRTMSPLERRFIAIYLSFYNLHIYHFFSLSK
jgi:hypothetical protein